MQDIDVLVDVASKLEQAGFEYMVTGSVAANFYAPARTTNDLDLIVELAVPDVQRIVALFIDDYYLDDLAIQEAIVRRRSFNLIHYTALIKVDFILRKDTEYQQSQFGRRRRLSAGDKLVWVLAPEDLILAKLDWARESRSERQLADVRNIWLSGQPLDRSYLRDWAGRLGLERLLHEATS
jgi:hypothetical protein